VKPAALGIIAAGLLRIGRAALTDRRLVVIAILAFGLLWVARIDLLVVMAAAGLANVVSRRVVRVPPVLFSLVPVVALTPAGWLDFAWAFLKTGLFSFGGAYGSIAFLEQEAVTQRGWLTTSQLLDGVALSVATPGPFMLFATFAGYLVAGIPGAIVATVVIFLPSFVFILAFARWIERALAEPVVREAIAGISAAVVAVILSVTITLGPAAVTDPLAGAIAGASFAAVVFAKRDVALVAGIAMLAGVALAVARAL
jgi:chromate transporter